MSRVLSILLGLALVRGAAAQGRPLTALSAEEQTRLALSTAPPEVSWARSSSRYNRAGSVVALPSAS